MQLPGPPPTSRPALPSPSPASSAPPIRLRPYRLTLAKRQAAEEQIQDMAAAGVIEPSDSQWAAPAVLVKKKDDGWRFCVDHRRLNAMTKKDSCPLHRLTDRSRPYAVAACEYYPRQEAWAQLAPTVATLRAVDGEAGWLPLIPTQVQEEQERDAALAHVRGWLAAGRWSEWEDVATLDAETRWWGWPRARRCAVPVVAGPRPRGQLLVPRALRSQVLQLVHGATGAGHIGNNKTLRRLRGQFYCPGCRRNVEMNIHCCDSCTAQKGPTRHSHSRLRACDGPAPGPPGPVSTRCAARHRRTFATFPQRLCAWGAPNDGGPHFQDFVMDG
ncbi:hypothetical protein AAFF_G00011280 [Aldrovandia affinis]|uniref:Gypsy retrotransposon integrase-like protein 1 n=1 Tax=Aldrovandia affinis TaxID=143900 RepID=A0AAD7S6Z9_9TELE|nr:hypothetical protein AAFF_G00011280 [Aldrovandia affinis]